MNAIGTQLRHPINSGDPMAYGGFINGRRRGTREESRKHQIQPEYGDEQADAGRDG